ncbi:MAG: hypothetical protein RLZZ488_1817 [Pseudomonadota bacterium]|jgi:adenylate cyclase
MKPQTTVNELILNEEIEQERRLNGRVLNRLRILAVASFLLLHLIMGYGLGKPAFVGKENLLGFYLAIAVSFSFLPERVKRFELIREFSIPLLDVPMTYLVIDAWVTSVADPAVFRILGALGLAFMMFFVNLSGLFFSATITTPVTLAGLAVIMQLFNKTETPIDTKVTGFLLLGLTGYATVRISSRVKKLVAGAAEKQSLNEKLSRYFAPEVAAVIGNSEGSDNHKQRRFDVTVIFTDIRGFTKLSSEMGGEDVIRMLNEIHEHLVSCIFLTGGTLDKYLGDGVMAYYGAPVKTDDHADKALECALMMRAQIAAYNEKRKSRGEHPIQIGIGIHSGSAIIGDIGAEIRREFTIIGDTVNTASRIESLTKKHQVDILLTSATRDRLSKPAQVRALGIDEIRGTQNTIETFTL